MSGIDERPQPQLTFDMVWPSIEEELKRERDRRNWSDVYYAYFRLVARDEVIRIVREGLVPRDYVEESRWQKLEGWIRNVWYR